MPARPSVPLRFPYMFWAKEESHAGAFPLSQSGAPTIDPAVLGAVRLDLSPPSADAQPRLEAALARHLGLPPERVLITPGASGAMHLVAMRFFPGAHVVTELPSYEPFRALAAVYGEGSTLVPRSASAGFRADPERFARALAGHRPAHLFLCTPHNPTGAITSPEELAGLARAAESAGGILIANEIYLEFAGPGAGPRACQLAPNAVSLGSLTKAYGLGPLRIGWIALGEGLAHERAALLDCSYLAYVDSPTVSLRAGAAALARLEALIEPTRELARTSRPVLASWLGATPGVEGFVGPLGLTAFPRLDGIADTRTFARALARERGVVVVPGEFFGLAGYVRVGYGLAPDRLHEALDRLARGIADARAGRLG
jgi:hypothetical protein